jgi:glutamate synthase (NADPH/NADH) small chain
MGKTTGFKEYDRELPRTRPVAERTKDAREIYQPFPEEKLVQQAARCMDCGVPTCHSGCPLGNMIPDWNELVYRGQWRAALDQLLATNNFPEFTGRLCPAPCEEACVLSINEPAVTIELIEKHIVEKAFDSGWMEPQPPKRRSDKRVAVIGSGPAGLACAQQLNRAGHTVSVFERADRIGGLLRYGIPDFKLEKSVLDRRLDLMAAEGIRFETGVDVGRSFDKEDLAGFDAVVLCIGSTHPRNLPIPGRELTGIHFAMEFLTRHNRHVAKDAPGQAPSGAPVAKDKHVVVIGGGDTGSDCVGTCHRQGALSVTSFELMPEPAPERTPDQPWPFWPMRLRTSSSHEEGGQRFWNILSKRFYGQNGRVAGIETVAVEFVDKGGERPIMQEKPGTIKRWPADLVLLAMGFVGPETDTIVNSYGLALSPNGAIATDQTGMTSQPGVFAAGDARRGQSLVVWAIAEGREVARQVDIFLMGRTLLPEKGCCDLPRS